MTEIRDKSHALIFDNKKDSPMYKIRKDIIEIKELLKELHKDIGYIKKKIGKK